MTIRNDRKDDIRKKEIAKKSLKEKNIFCMGILGEL
jgi:hypothetical protein